MLVTTNAPSSELGDSGIAVTLPGLRVISAQDLSEDVLKRSGIERGMRVLELECGTGSASLLIARLIGPSGLVVGVDRSAQAVDVAEKRATVAGYCYWTRFVTADPNCFVPDERFDAVVVWQTHFHQGDRAVFLRLSAYVPRLLWSILPSEPCRPVFYPFRFPARFGRALGPAARQRRATG
jgi:SAM-dependent methyltransferase